LTKAPVYNEVYNWTGFYVGANLGGAWGLANDSSYSQPGGTIDSFDFGSTTKASVIGGLHVGYNWQVAPTWLIGAEGDFSWLSLGNSFGARQVTIGGVPAVTGLPAVPMTLSMTSKEKWLSSVRGRVGYVWDTLLLYGTGGVAWGKANYNGFMTGDIYSSVATSFSNTSTGWVAGVGLEKVITGNWLIRGEYLYYGLHSTQTSLAPCGLCIPLPSGNPIAFHWGNSAVQETRVALSYKFP
jgi:outer membrane immunogenic protein